MSYEPTVWATGDVITSTKLNKLENGLAEASGGGGGGGGVLVVTLDFDTLTLDKTWNEIASSSLAVLKVNADNATHFSTLYMTDILGENEFAVYFFRIEGGSRIESEIFKASSADGYPVAEE